MVRRTATLALTERWAKSFCEIGLREEGDQLHAFRQDGLTHWGGSVMRAFQPATAYTDTKRQTPPGVLLRHHFRWSVAMLAKREPFSPKPDQEIGGYAIGGTG